MNPRDFDWKKYLIECMSSTNFCCISTVDPKGVWSNPVYFAWDTDFNFFFISQMHSRHMQNIQNNSRISMAIYKTEQKDDVVGIQLEGTAKIITDNDNLEEIKHAYEIYYRRAGHGPDVQGYTNDPSWLYVRVTPEQMYYFDTRFFKEEKQVVPLQKLMK